LPDSGRCARKELVLVLIEESVLAFFNLERFYFVIKGYRGMGRDSERCFCEGFAGWVGRVVASRH